MSVRRVATLVLGIGVTTGVAEALPIQDVINGYDAETRAALESELSTCPECTVEQLADGSPNVVVPPDAHPLSSGSTAPSATTTLGASATACVPLRTVPTLQRDADHFHRIGNTWFGAYYRAGSHSATAPTRLGDQSFHADVVSAVGATVFGFNLDVARGDASADARTNGYRSTAGHFYARNRYGAMINVGNASTSVTGNATIVPAQVNATFWSGDYGFTLGPIPVTVHGELTGAAGYVVSSTTNASTASVTGTPTAGLYAYGSISANGGIVAIGVDGRVIIAEGALPTRASMAKTGTGYSYNLGSDVRFTLLSGSIDAWVRVGFWRFKKTWRRNLARWTGTVANAALYTDVGQVPYCDFVVGPGSFF